METADNVDLNTAVSDAERILNETKQEVKKEEAKEEVVTADVTETPIVETGDAPVIEEELVPHGERSRLGRKVKRLEDTLGEIKSSLDFLKERTSVQTTTQAQVEEEPELPENPTAEEIKEYVKKDRERVLKSVEQKQAERASKANESQRKYATEYARLVEEALDPDDDAEVYKMITDAKDLTYNQVYKGDPKEDFIINYRNATKALLTKTKTPKVSTVHGKKPTVPTGVNVPGTTKVEAKLFDRSKLSPAEAEAAKMFTDDELAAMNIG